MFKEAISVFLLSKLIGKERTKKLDIFLKKHTKNLASIIFVLNAIFHTVRFPIGFDIIVGDWLMPMWMSFVIMLISVYLAYRLKDN